MSSVQVFGPDGMLGKAVCNAFRLAGWNIIEDHADILSKDIRIDCELVVNCAGIVKQRLESPKQFFLVNGCGPHILAAKCDVVGARLIHVSTDCVFNGYRGPYSENDITTATDVYGLSKAVGEIEYGPHVTVRTSFIGPGKRGLVQQMKDQRWTVASGKFLWNGHTVGYVAKAIVEIAQRDIRGILHIPGETITRLELVSMIKDFLKLDTKIIENDFHVDRRLASNRWGDYGLPRFPPIKEQIEEWMFP